MFEEHKILICNPVEYLLPCRLCAPQLGGAVGQPFRRAGVGRVGRISQFHHRTLTALYFSLMKSINIDLREGGGGFHFPERVGSMVSPDKDGHAPATCFDKTNTKTKQQYHVV